MGNNFEMDRMELVEEYQRILGDGLGGFIG